MSLLSSLMTTAIVVGAPIEAERERVLVAHDPELDADRIRSTKAELFRSTDLTPRDRHYYATVCPPMNRRVCKPCDRSSFGRCKEHRKQDARERAAR